MSRRFRMSRSGSRRSFKRGDRLHRRNLPRASTGRGGGRL